MVFNNAVKSFAKLRKFWYPSDNTLFLTRVLWFKSEKKRFNKISGKVRASVLLER